MSRPTEYLTADQLTEGYYWCYYKTDSPVPCFMGDRDEQGGGKCLEFVGDPRELRAGSAVWRYGTFAPAVPPPHPPEVTEAWLKTVPGLTYDSRPSFDVFRIGPTAYIDGRLTGNWGLYIHPKPHDVRARTLLTREDVLLAVKLFGGPA